MVTVWMTGSVDGVSLAAHEFSAQKPCCHRRGREDPPHTLILFFFTLHLLGSSPPHAQHVLLHPDAQCVCSPSPSLSSSSLS